VVNYLCSEPYNPGSEHGINPLDRDLAIPYESKLNGTPYLVSPKDSSAPSLLESKQQGILPETKHVENLFN
jgi:dTDP-4-dehydrorhamnose 3,5-epimerase